MNSQRWINENQGGLPLETGIRNAVLSTNLRGNQNYVATPYSFLGWAGTQHTQPGKVVPIINTNSYKGIVPLSYIPQIIKPLPFRS